MAGWILLMVLLGIGVVLQYLSLSKYYQISKPAAGGTYTEGMVGSFTNANPLYASNLTDNTVSRLLFAGLVKYDSNNELAGDLAESWTIDESDKVYIFKLRPNLVWHDGAKLTSDDVLFTFKTVQNSDAKSPLFAGWQGINIEVIDDLTIKFTLRSALAPFIDSLTTGIIPRHKLGSTEIAQLRSAAFNTSQPIGSGPFKWSAIEVSGNPIDSRQQHIGLKAFDRYHAGAPKLTQFIVSTFVNDNQLIDAFKDQQLNAIIGQDRLPDDIPDPENTHQYPAPLTALSMAFFNTTTEPQKDKNIRQALTQSVNVPEIVSGLGFPVIVANQPFLAGQTGYDPSLKQSATDIGNANKLLTDAGWIKSDNEFRNKDGKELNIKLIADNNPDNAHITKQIQKSWMSIGINTEVQLLSDKELQNSIKSRDYDVLIYGISVGKDPDIFAYWHSSQNDPRSVSQLNFSGYSSTIADEALKSGRSRLDPQLRTAKYKPFLEAWQADAPAIALYQPRFLYITHGKLFGFEPITLNIAADRFSNVHNWMIRQSKQDIVN